MFLLDFEEYSITEGFANLFTAEEKSNYVDVIWDMLHASYANIGGMKGNGFQSKKDMIDKIIFWKVAKTNGKINAFALYKDKGGRKRVAVGTDGTSDGKYNLFMIVKEDLVSGRSYSEMSSKLLSFAVKNIPNIKKYCITFEDVEKKIGEEIRRPDEDDPELIRHPDLKDYLYTREIGGSWKTKLMLGNINAPEISF